MTMFVRDALGPGRTLCRQWIVARDVRTRDPRRGPRRAIAPAPAVQRVRSPDALRPGRGVPSGHHQQGAHAIGVRFAELLWFCAVTPTSSGSRTARVIIWDEWADAGGDLGPVYGYQW